ncbi:MAG TPA: class I SAM-dependent methyltransferase [Clostridia bacterium]|nr:class I SAM-dependent methyltransferase [Clostridia bacterium]
MKLSRSEVLSLMKNDKYPLSSKYDPDWIIENALGSHCLWLMEALAQIIPLKPSMRVLDIGCGKAISSIFLAKEFGVKVWATDLRANPTENFQRIHDARVEDMVFPVRADAHNLPYADSYFDAIVGINSLQLFAQGGNYLRENLVRHVKPGGSIGMVVPGIYREFNDGIPEYLQLHVAAFLDDFKTWHSPEWWREHFARAGNTDIELIDAFPDGEGNMLYGKSSRIDRSDDEDSFYNDDNGRNITFVRILVRRKEL